MSLLSAAIKWNPSTRRRMTEGIEREACICGTVKQVRCDISSCLAASVSYRAVTSHTETSPIKNNVTGKEMAWQVEHATADFYSCFNCSPRFHVPYCAVNAAAGEKKIKDER